jgi:prepilin-type N-terminal cleavage/methylation domain-containing protein
MRDTKYEHGFTLVELLVALVVSSLILTTVATLAFALGRATDATDDTSRKQAEVRFATLRISELIRQCRLICGTPGGELAVWQADDNSDGQINVNELVYVERGTGKNYLRLCEFPASDTSVVPLANVAALSPSGYGVTRATLIPQCSNVEFLIDVAPPRTKFVSISFDLAEDSVVHHYQINSAVRGWAGNLLSADGQSIVTDDD